MRLGPKTSPKGPKHLVRGDHYKSFKPMAIMAKTAYFSRDRIACCDWLAWASMAVLAC